MVICDIVLFYGATNVQNYSLILSAEYPYISIGHEDEHFFALFFLGLFSKIPLYESIMNFANILCNIFGITRHATTAMFNKYSKMHDQVIKVILSSPLIAGKYKLQTFALVFY